MFSVLFTWQMAGRTLPQNSRITTVRLSYLARLPPPLLKCHARDIAYLLSHLMSVVEHLEPAWCRAFLRRTRFLDADFQGDVLAVISTHQACFIGYPVR